MTVSESMFVSDIVEHTVRLRSTCYSSRYTVQSATQDSWPLEHAVIDRYVQMIDMETDIDTSIKRWIADADWDCQRHTDKNADN